MYHPLKSAIATSGDVIVIEIVPPPATNRQANPGDPREHTRLENEPSPLPRKKCRIHRHQRSTAQDIQVPIVG